MTMREKLELMKVMDKHNADAIAALKKMDEDIARRRAQRDPAYGWRVEKVRRTPEQLAEIEARMARPLTRAERRKRAYDREVLRRAYELDAKDFAPSPLQQKVEIAVTLLWMWTQKKVTA